MLSTSVKKVSIKGKFKIKNDCLYFVNIKQNNQYYKNIVNEILEKFEIPYKAVIQCGIIVLKSKMVNSYNQHKLYNIDCYRLNYCDFKYKK